MDTKYFRVPFATSGDVATIPDDTQIDGSMSYEQGFGPDYELEQSDPDAKDVPRDQTNELYKAITENLQQYQQFGVPQFITTADNDGSPFPYSKDAMCRYDAGGGEIVYVSLVDSNSALPTDTTKWLPLPAFILNQIEVESDANRQSLDGVVEAWDVYAGNSSGSTQTVSFSSLATMGSTDYDIQVTRLARGGGALSLSDVPTVSNITTTSFDLTFASSVNSSWTYSWRVKGLGVLA